jgi:hypothetical protein
MTRNQQPPSLDLHLPDWSGHQPTRFWRETVDQMNQRSEALLPLVKRHPSYSERRRGQATDLPFRL